MASQKKQDEIYRTSQNIYPENISMLRQYRVGKSSRDKFYLKTHFSLFIPLLFVVINTKF